MDEAAFKERTRQLGLAVIALSRSIRHDLAADVILRQVVRFGQWAALPAFFSAPAHLPDFSVG